AGFPVGLGLLDALAAARDEVPPHVARAIERRAAEQQQPRRLLRRDHQRAGSAEHVELAGLRRLAAERDLARDRVDRALLVLGCEDQPRAGGELGVGEEQWAIDG